MTAGLATLAAELVGRRAGGGIRADADRDLVLAGLDRHVLRDRRLALRAPRPELVLTGREAAERERAMLVGDDVRRRRDDGDVRAHVRVQVAAEAHDALLGERVLAGLADLVDAEVERGGRR